MIKYQARINVVLEKYLPSANDEPKNLHAAMRYSVLNGGKRLRPALVYITGESYGANIKNLDAPAAAIEMIHSFSLIHDDLPAMDNDDLRRGKPTCHKAFDEATAILAGDALMALAFQILDDVAMVKVLAEAAGSRGMGGGQDIDIQSLGKKLSLAELENMYILKTGALICASVKIGAFAAGVSNKKDITNLEKFARCLGLAFQIQDDIFDNDGYSQIVGIKTAKEKVLDLHQEADLALKQLSVDASRFKELLEYVKQRSF